MIINNLNRLRRIQNYLYSSIIRSGFKAVGEHFRIEYPFRIEGGSHISIGHNFTCYGRMRLEAFDEHNGNLYKPLISIGDNVSINFDCHIGCVNEIIIGNNVLIASRVFITDHLHGHTSLASIVLPPSERRVYSKGPVIIEDNVWIGEGVAIMPNVTIGVNSIIGANSVVTKSFPANSVIAGVPAKLIKTIRE